MITPDYTVSPLDEADVPTLARFIYASNLQQTTNRFLFSDWPNEEAQLNFYMPGMQQSFKDSSNHLFKAVDNASGEILATLCLSRKKPASAEVISSAMPGPPPGIKALNTEFHSLLREKMVELQKVMAETDHLVLSSIFVRPSSRKQGIGKQLVQLSMERAKAANVPLSLCSVPTAHKFYQDLGFSDLSYLEVDLTKWAPEYSGYGIYRLFLMQRVD